MQIVRYKNQNQKELLSKIGTDYPYLFLKQYHEFENKLGADVALVLSEDKSIAMPILFFKKYLFRFIRILYPPLKSGKQLSKIEEKKFLEGFISLTQKNKLCHKVVQPPMMNGIFVSIPDEATFCELGYYAIHFENKTDEEIFSNFQSRTGRAVRSAEKKGAIVKYGREQLPIFYKIVKDTYDQSNKFFESYYYYESLFDSLKDNVLCAVVYHENRAQGALFVPYTEYGGFLLSGGATKDQSQNGLVKFLHWEVIRKLKSKGVKKCYFGNTRLGNVSDSKLSGIQNFKMRFGGEITTGFLWKKNINKTYSFIYDLLFFLYFKLRGLKVPLDVIDYEAQNRKNKV